MTTKRTQLQALRLVTICWLAGVTGIVESAPGPERLVASDVDSFPRTAQADARSGTTSFSLGARSDYIETDGSSTAYRSIVATAKLRLASPERSYATVLLFEYAAIEDRDDTAILATMLTYRTARWSMSFAPYIRMTATGRRDWRQQTTLRYRLGPRSALGVELIGPIDAIRGSRLSLGYYGKLSESLSFSTLVGSGIDAGPDVALRTSLTWRVR